MPMTTASLLLFSIFFVPGWAHRKVFHDHLSVCGLYIGCVLVIRTGGQVLPSLYLDSDYN